jgi:hypothetical protein
VAPFTTPSPSPPSVALAPATTSRDLSKLSPLQQQVYLSCRRGADWLFCMNGVKGRFLHGYLPALKAGLEGDHYLHQVGAAHALAHLAQMTGEERYAVRATQALLTLLDETIADPNDANVRYTSLPSVVVNRLGAAGLLVLAIHELPNPPADLLDRGEQLCNYIRQQARTDGSLRCDDASTSADDPASVSEYPGLALHGLVHSCKLRPAPWKIDMVRKAAVYYRQWWQTRKDRDFVTAQSAACVEAYLATRDRVFADFVWEMNDWLCDLQYGTIDPRRALWTGGFRSWADGHAVDSMPQVDSARCAESLAHACRLSREIADLGRHQRYVDVVEHCLQFLTTLQYTEANTQHYADWYRPRLLGAFYASHQDGNLRIDHTEHALDAMAVYLESEVVR